MKKNIFSPRSMAVGLVAGLLIGSGGMYVYSSPQPIDAYRDDSYGFRFNGGDKVTLSGDFTTVVYKDRSYVPVRFISDNLGAKLTWDEATKTITMDAPEKVVEKIVEKIVEKPVEKETEYRGFPQAYVAQDIRLDMTMFRRNADRSSSQFYLSFENKGSTPWQISVLTAKFIGDNGKTYDALNIPNDIDQRLYNNINKDKTVEGYLAVSAIPDEVKKGTLQFTIFPNDGSGKKTELSFPVKLD